MSKKEPSNRPESSIGRFTLPKSRILSGKRNFQRLFSNSTFITSPSVNLRFTVYPNPEEKVLVGFIAPKNIGNAVKRVRAKRLLREAYRLNQQLLTEITDTLNIGIHLVFLARHSKITFKQVQDDIINLMKEMQMRLLSNNSPFLK